MVVSQRKRFLIDCDRPLADFDKRVKQWLVQRGLVKRNWQPPPGLYFTQRSLPEEVQKLLHKWAAGRGFTSGVEPIRGSKRAVQRLRKLGDLYCVTSPWPKSRYWAGERALWLHKHYGFTEQTIIQTAAKHCVYGDWLIEDRFDALIEWGEHHPNGRLALWKHACNQQHWNDSRVTLIDGWSDERFWAEIEK